MRSSRSSVVTPTRAAPIVGYRAHAGARSEAEPRLIVVISLNICCEPPTTVSLVFENPRCLGLHTQADLSIHAEAVFALWDLQIRERNLAAAIAIAQGLARDFPDNRELAKFLERHDPFQP